MTGDPAALVRRFYDEAWNRADEAVAREILHPEIAFRGSLGPERRGIDGFIDYMRAVHAALGDYRCTIDDLVATRSRAAARLTFAGVHRGALFGVAATGRRISWAGAAFFAVAGGRITEVWVVGDVDAVKRQLGATAGAGFAE